jgi:5-methylcytosine-specific restriction endonuclease McrA
MVKTKKIVIKNPRVVRNRNNGTQTESAFWGTIRAVLRQASRWWKPIAECKKRARRSYIGSNKRRKIAYECNHCKKLFLSEEITVDHIIGAGTLKCAEDLPGFVTRLFCEVQGLQCLCLSCHSLKTKKEKEK